jgi:hypothetical protein
VFLLVGLASFFMATRPRFISSEPPFLKRLEPNGYDLLLAAGTEISDAEHPMQVTDQFQAFVEHHAGSFAHFDEALAQPSEAPASAYQPASVMIDLNAFSKPAVPSKRTGLF